MSRTIEGSGGTRRPSKGAVVLVTRLVLAIALVAVGAAVLTDDTSAASVPFGGLHPSADPHG